MFYTLTANPAVDMTVSCPPLVPNENIRSFSASYTANGKGLDVSFALKKFGVDSVALGFFAGFTGKYVVDETMNMGCLCRPVWIDGVTRINSYFNDGQSEHGILNPDEERALEERAPIPGGWGQPFFITKNLGSMESVAKDTE